MKIIAPSSIAGFNPSHLENCTVVALASSTGIPYPAAHDLASLAGRKSDTSFDSPELIEFFNKVAGPDRLEEIEVEGTSLVDFLKKHPKEKFFVRRNALEETSCSSLGDRYDPAEVKRDGHAYAIVDGVLVNGLMPNPDEKITQAWEFRGNPARPCANLERQGLSSHSVPPAPYPCAPRLPKPESGKGRKSYPHVKSTVGI